MKKLNENHEIYETIEEKCYVDYLTDLAFSHDEEAEAENEIDRYTADREQGIKECEQGREEWIQEADENMPNPNARSEAEREEYLRETRKALGKSEIDNEPKPILCPVTNRTVGKGKKSWGFTFTPCKTCLYNKNEWYQVVGEGYQKAVNNFPFCDYPNKTPNRPYDRMNGGKVRGLEQTVTQQTTDTVRKIVCVTCGAEMNTNLVPCGKCGNKEFEITKEERTVEHRVVRKLSKIEKPKVTWETMSEKEKKDLAFSLEWLHLELLDRNGETEKYKEAVRNFLKKYEGDERVKGMEEARHLYGI